MKKRKYIFSYIVIFIVTSTIIAAITFGIIIYNIRSEQSRTYTSTMALISQNIDDRISTIESFISQISQTKWINKIMYMQGNSIDYDRIPYLSLVEYEGELVNFVKSNGFIDDMALVFHKKDFVLSTMGKHTVADFKKYVFSVSDSDFWEQLDTDYSAPKYDMFNDVEFYGLKKQGMLYYTNLPINTIQTADTTLLLFTDIAKFENILENKNGDDMKYILTDNTGRVILTNAGGIERGTVFSGNLKNNQCYLHVSEKTGWNYYSVVSSSKINFQIFTGLLTAFLIFIMVLVAGVLLVIKFAAKNYKPLNEFIDSLKTSLNLDNDLPENEFYQIGNEVKKILDRQNSLTGEIVKQKPIIRNTYLSYLLNADEKLETLKGFDAILDIEFPYQRFCCFSTGQVKLTLPTYPNMKAYTVELIDATAVLLNYDSISEEYFSQITAQNKGVSIGIGEEALTVGEINKSYIESVKAYAYSEILKQDIVYYNKVKFRDDYYFPDDVKNQLSNSMKAANEQETVEIINTLSAKNEAYCNGDALVTFFVEIQITAIKLLNEVGKAQGLTPNINYAKKDEVINLCRNVCRFYKNRIENSKKFEMNEIMSFVDGHFKDYTISLNTVGDHFGFSPSYISKYFKENYNVNFLDYVNKKRLDLSKELLLKSNLDILMIAKSVGYDNDVTFRRLFKKQEGITPSEYRKINKISI